MTHRRLTGRRTVARLPAPLRRARRNRRRRSRSPRRAFSLNWIGVLSGTTTCSLAATTGAHTGADALKLLLAGADVAPTTSALLQHGPEHLAVIEAEMRAWMDARNYDSVEQLKGSVSRRNVPDPRVNERANYHQALHPWKLAAPAR